ncbi:MAG: YidC/Oxa1 family insertase periplasmic-domain containing protein [Planctomycetales bacterium]|nr:YidC/Oxa1 family insertase periplasmic-domain containing protein [Planctomycetales bacterium]
MDRRFFTWLMLTTALVFLYLSARQNQQQALLKQQAAQAEAQQEKPLSEEPLFNPPQRNGEEAEQMGGDKSAPYQAITLGSMDPSKGYNLLVTVSTAGAGVERVELVSQNSPGRFRYRALEHEGGYLGSLGLRETLTGLAVNTVPDGSPAALAVTNGIPGGVEIGDVITEVNGQPALSLQEYQRVMLATKAGRPMNFSVSRDMNGTAQVIEFTTNLCEAPLDLVRVEPFLSEAVTGNNTVPSLRTTLASLNNVSVPSGQNVFPALQGTVDANWEMHPLEVPGGMGVEFRFALTPYLENIGKPSALELVKRYRLFPQSDTQDGYLLDLETELINHNEEAVQLAIRQEGINGLSLEGWWYSVKISPKMFAAAGQRDVLFNTPFALHQLKSTRELLDQAKKTPNQPNISLFSENEAADARKLNYIGIDSQYFNASILPHEDSPDSLTDLRQAQAFAMADPDKINRAQSQAANTSFWFDTLEREIPSAGSFTQRYQVFLGPKDTELLAAHNLGFAIEYGWFPLVAKPLGWILHIFYAVVGNYGVAIIMLTVVVRGCMFPLGRKAAINAQKMQELQPELKRINDLHKDNMEKRAKAMQELYSKHNFRPLAGCLPMFIQLPIFIGLYRCLSIDISLRQAALIPGMSWCSNLAGPDQLLDWSGWMPQFFAGRGIGWLGPYFNLLPMVTVALFLVQQKMLMPKATDEQTRMTQNMMQIMTVFMGVMFFKVPSGLCIYFITSSLWSLVERNLVKRLVPPNVAANALPASSGESKQRSNVASEKSTEVNKVKTGPAILKEVRQLLDKPAVKSSTQRNTQKEPRKKRR